MHLAEGVVQGGVEWAGAHERGEHRDRVGQTRACLPTSAASPDVLVFDRPGDVDRMAVFRYPR